jgi:hypothetical protein
MDRTNESAYLLLSTSTSTLYRAAFDLFRVRRRSKGDVSDSRTMPIKQKTNCLHSVGDAGIHDRRIQREREREREREIMDGLKRHKESDECERRRGSKVNVQIERPI